jgi:hypothetical protein
MSDRDPDFDLYDAEPEGFDIYSWSPTPAADVAAGKPQAPSTQVHLAASMPFGRVFWRFKGPDTLDRLIGALIKHRVDVFGMPAGPPRLDGRQAVSAPKFTAGPWVLGNENNECCDVFTGKTTIALDRIDPHVGCIVISREEMLANAHLVAAAPELLSALELMVAACPNGFSGSIYGNAHVAARAAIAKATKP